LLLDDELPGLTYLKMLCEQLPELEVVKTYDHPLSLMNDLPNLEIDLLIMDIEMPFLNGIELSKQIGNLPVIFTTAYSHYAAEAFDIDAIDFVRKPLTLDRLRDAVLKANRRISSPPASKLFGYFNTNKGKSLIFFDQICYITASEIDSRDKRVLMEDGHELIFKNISFDALMDELPPIEFCRVNRFEVIALKHVKMLSNDSIITNVKLKNEEQLTLSLSESYKNEFLQKVSV
jgi:DNA-binding LytR/AlgR family response regulator